MNWFEWAILIYISIGILFDIIAITVALLMKNKQAFYAEEFIKGIIIITFLWPWCVYDIIVTDDVNHD